MSSNRVTLAQLRSLPAQEVHDLPLPQVALLLEDVAELEANAKACKAILTGSLHTRFGENAAGLRREKGKDTGTVRIHAEGCEVLADLPKKVTYDQALLRVALETIKGWGEDPAEYVSVEIKVPEAKYGAWPSTIRKVFEPARTVGTGSPVYKVEIKEAA